jgi:tetratricopeptide (TPR) repeat protein
VAARAAQTPHLHAPITSHDQEEPTVALIDKTLWNQIAPYLDQALELEPVALERWLAGVSEKQPTLANLVRRRLAELEELNAQGFMCEPPDGSADLASADPVPLAGTKIGGYTIDRHLGSGGMGEVWLAARSDGLFEGRCAIKFFHGTAGHGRLADRFRREGRLLARLTHPHIGRLLDAGIAGDGRQFLLLEYVDGECIDRYCEAQGLGIDARVRLFLDVVSAVAYAHSQLIIHRDLKPSNVLVTRDGVVKLLDFGIAELLTDDEVSSNPAARAADIAFTPEYAAPEQVLGKVPSTQTDVYQLGMLLYVLLTGRHPTSVSGSREERIKAALGRVVPRASDAASHSAHGKLRGDLDAILSTALHPDPAERYPTAAALSEDLTRYLDREPVNARRGAALYLAQKFFARHWRAALAAGFVAMTFVAAFVLTTLQLRETRQQRELAVASAQRAEASKDFFRLVLSELQLRGEPLTTKALIERSSTLLRTRYADHPAFVSEMLIELAHGAIDMMELNAALSLLTDANDIARARSDNRLLADSECIMSRLYTQNGRPDEAARHLTRGTEALGKMPSPDLDARVQCMYAQADIHARSGNRRSAVEVERHARSMLEAAGETHGSLYPAILSALGSDLMDDGKVVESLSVFRLALDSHDRNGRAGTRVELIARQNVAAALYRLGEVLAAYDTLRPTRDALLKLNSTEDVSAISVINASGSANRLARHDRVLELLPAALARSEKEHDVYYFRLASAELARTRMRLGSPRAEVEASLDHLQAARIDGKPVMDPAAEVLVDSVRAELDLREGRPRAADDRAEQLLRHLTELKFERPRSRYLAFSLAAKTALAAGDPARAFEHARAALQIVEPIARAADTSADVGDALLIMGKALIAQGKPGDARALLERASKCLSNGYGADHPTTRDASQLSTRGAVVRDTTRG